MIGLSDLASAVELEWEVASIKIGTKPNEPMWMVGSEAGELLTPRAA